MIKNGRLYTFDPDKEKQVLCGVIIGDTLFRQVSEKHFMRVVQGYGIQEIAFQELLRENVKNIVLKHGNTGQTLRSSLSCWTEHGKVMNFGNGKQRFLSVRFMEAKLKTPSVGGGKSQSNRCYGCGVLQDFQGYCSCCKYEK